MSGQDDCTDEISVDDDPTLSTTNLDQSSEVATVIEHGGGTSILVVLELMDGIDRFDATDTPVSIVHGTEDVTVPFSEAETIRPPTTRRVSHTSGTLSRVAVTAPGVRPSTGKPFSNPLTTSSSRPRR